MASTEFSIEIDGLSKLQDAMTKSPEIVYQELSNAVKTSIYLIRPIMAQEAPAKTGKLRRNISAYANGLEGKTGPNLEVTPYAWYVHQGTSPYFIRPKNKKALYWEGAPGGHPWKRVFHPGINANPFVVRTVKRVKDPVQLIFKGAIKRIVANLAV